MAERRDAIETNLLRISLDGKVVAEAVLTIHDQAGTWLAFQEAFSMIAPSLAGEMFNTMRIACDDNLRAIRGPQGFVIDLRTEPKADIVIPSNGHRDGHLRGL